MILFYLNHIMFLSKFTTMRYTKYLDKKCTLIARGTAVSEFIPKLEELDVFERVKICDVFPKERLNKKAIKQEILDLYDVFFDETNINIDQYDELITCCDGNDFFACYCQLKSIHYSVVEAIPYYFENENRFYTPMRPELTAVIDLIKDMRASTGDDGFFCNKRYLYPNGTAVTASRDELVDFDQLFQNIDSEYKDILIEVFNLNQKNIKFLFLAGSDGHTANMRGLYFGICRKMDYCLEYIYFCDLLLCDLCFPRDMQIYAKPHPNSNFEIFQKAFSKFNIWNSHAPIEYLQYLESAPIKKIMKTSSISTEKLGNTCQEVLYLNSALMKQYHLILKTYLLYFILFEMDHWEEVQALNFPLNILEFLGGNMLGFQEKEFYRKKYTIV